MSKKANGVANDYEFSNLYDPNISYSKAYTEQLLAEKDKEIERLNNIIDKFDKWLIREKMMFYKSDDGERLIRFGETKNKWLELKGDNK